MKFLRSVALVGLFALAAGCVRAPHPTYTTTFTDRAIRLGTYAHSFRNAEPTLVAELASDTRIFDRMIPKPATAQSGSSAPAWMSRAFVDPFQFTDREMVLQRTRESFDEIALPSDEALQHEMEKALRTTWDVEPADELLFARVVLEQKSFRRLLDAEDARLERERTLPQGAADLVRAVALAWPLSVRPGAVRDMESMLAWRFANLEQALAPGSLSEAERDDLRDAMNGLAGRVASLPRAAAAMVKTRNALDALWTTPYPRENEATMDRALAIYVGSPLKFDALDAAFESAANHFALQADAGLSVLAPRVRDAVLARAKEILLHPEPCRPRAPIATVLDLAPPQERAWSCALVHALDAEVGDMGELAADIAWHDAVVVARWAAFTHGPVRSVLAAERRAAPILSLTPAETESLARLAQAQPMRALAAGVAAVLLTSDGPEQAKARARAWRGLGDAPMDLIVPFLPKRRR